MVVLRWFRRWALKGLIMAALTAAVLPCLVAIVYSRIDPPLTPLMLIRRLDGEELHYHWRPLAEISPNLQRAVIAGEDNLFCRHFGFDTGAIGLSVRDWLDGRRARGASTITMQTAKNVLLWPGRDIIRKLIEAWMTLQIEALWGKQRILEVYLNVAEMGPGLYGAEAAARAFFRKSARNLNLAESSRLAAVLPNPREHSAADPDRFTRVRARTILARVGQLGPYFDCLRQL